MSITTQSHSLSTEPPRFDKAYVGAAISIGIECGMQQPFAVVIRIKPGMLTDRELCEVREDMFWHTSAALQRARIDERKRESTERARFNGRLVNLGIAMSASLVGDCEVCVEIDPHGTTMAHLRNVWDRVFSELRERVAAMRPYATGVHA